MTNLRYGLLCVCGLTITYFLVYISLLLAHQVGVPPFVELIKADLIVSIPAACLLVLVRKAPLWLQCILVGAFSFGVSMLMLGPRSLEFFRPEPWARTALALLFLQWATAGVGAALFPPLVDALLERRRLLKGHS